METLYVPAGKTLKVLKDIAIARETFIMTYPKLKGVKQPPLPGIKTLVIGSGTEYRSDSHQRLYVFRKSHAAMDQ